MYWWASQGGAASFQGGANAPPRPPPERNPDNGIILGKHLHYSPLLLDK